MKEVKVFVDGKEVESIEKLVEMFVNVEIPDHYKSIDDYLYLSDLDVNKIKNLNILRDFNDKIMKRVKFAREHPSYVSSTFDYDKIMREYSAYRHIHGLYQEAYNTLIYYFEQLKEIKNQK